MSITAKELIKLPIKQREKILKEAAQKVVDDYENDPNLTSFEANDEKDFITEEEYEELLKLLSTLPKFEETDEEDPDPLI